MVAGASSVGVGSSAEVMAEGAHLVVVMEVDQAAVEEEETVEEGEAVVGAAKEAAWRSDINAMEASVMDMIAIMS